MAGRRSAAGLIQSDLDAFENDPLIDRFQGFLGDLAFNNRELMLKVHAMVDRHARKNQIRVWAKNRHGDQCRSRPDDLAADVRYWFRKAETAFQMYLEDDDGDASLTSTI